MTNLYYNFTDPAISFSVVDGIRYNVEMQKITTAFDNFPPPVEFSSGSINYGAQPGGQPVNTYSIPVTAIQPGNPYEAGNNVAFKVATTNTGPSTLEVSNNGFRALLIGTAGALVAGDMRVPAIYTGVYDGTQFRTLEMSARYLGLAEASAPIAVAAADAAAADAALTLTAKNTAVAASGPAVASANAAAASESAASTSRQTASLSENSASNSASQALSARQSAVTQAANALTSQNNAQAAAAAAVAAQDAAIESNQDVTDSANAASASAMAAADANTTAQGIVSAPDFNDRVKQVILETELVVNCVELFATNENPNTIYSGTTWVRLPADVSLTIANATGSNVFTQAGADTVTMDTNTMPVHSHDASTVTSSSTALTATIANGGPGTFNTNSQFVLGSLSTLPSQQFTLSSVSYGALTLQSAGNHVHAIPVKEPNATLTGYISWAGISGGTTGTATTDVAGAHTHTFAERIHNHTITVPAHSHDVPALEPHTHDYSQLPHDHQLALGTHTHTGTLTVNAGGGSSTPFSVVNSNLKLVAWRRTA